MARYVLGFSCFYHDAAAALLRDGQLIAAVCEARLSRRKHDADFPVRAMRYCLEQAGIEASQLERVAFYEKPLLKLERAIDTAMATAPAGWQRFVTGIPRFLTRDLRLADQLRDWLGYEGELVYVPHHHSHAASAFFTSPFERAAVLTCDGVGEWQCNTLGVGEANQLRIQRALHFPHSVGLLYSAFTEHLGFAVNNGEFKVMGLAPYGTPRFVDAILDDIVHVGADGAIRLNLARFDFLAGERTAHFGDRFGPRRDPDGPLEDVHRDLAASIQQVLETILLRQGRAALALADSRNLCFAGGVALNSAANGRLARELDLDGLWIQPAAGDAGGALGAALATWHEVLQQPRQPTDDALGHGLLGPDPGDIQAALEVRGLRGEHVGDGIVARAADALADGAVLGWVRGRSEWGPRALGARSILADPRDAAMKDRVNARVKFREAFRPFAPMVLEEQAAEWFALEEPSRFMLQVVPVRREGLAATTHVDGTARVQTVPPSHPVAPLLEAFRARTGCPALLNTSFNLRGQPIACSAGDAIDTLRACELDALVLEDWWIEAPSQQPLPAPPAPLALPDTPAGTRTALTGGAVLGALCAALMWGERFEHAAVVGGLGVTLVAFGLLWPRAADAVEGRLRPVARQVATWQARALLFAVWWLLLTPLAWVRRAWRDPLDQRWPADATWRDAEPQGGWDHLF